MSSISVGFVGFGEVASVFSKAICENGADVLAYDIKFANPDGNVILQKRVRTKGLQFCPLPDLIGNVDYVLSTVTPQRAKEAAKSCVAYLRRGQIFLDLNSTSSLVKVEIGQIVQPSGADFVEGVILGAVGATGAETAVLTGGEKGNEVAITLTRLGLKVSYYSPEIGKASVLKMIRSIFSKGLEALLLELMIAGKRAGIEKYLWKDIIEEFMNLTPFERVAANWVLTHPIAYARRHHEMVQVAETMREIGVEPVMTSSTEAFFRRSCLLGLKEAFPEKPKSVADVIDFMERQLRENSKF